MSPGNGIKPLEAATPWQRTPTMTYGIDMSRRYPRVLQLGILCARCLPWCVTKTSTSSQLTAFLNAKLEWCPLRARLSLSHGAQQLGTPCTATGGLRLGQTRPVLTHATRSCQLSLSRCILFPGDTHTQHSSVRATLSCPMLWKSQHSISHPFSTYSSVVLFDVV